MHGKREGLDGAFIKSTKLGRDGTRRSAMLIAGKEERVTWYAAILWGIISW